MPYGLKNIGDYLRSNVLTFPFGWQDMKEQRVIEVPKEIETIIEGFDSSEEKLTSHIVSAALGAARRNLANDTAAFRNAWADSVAFALQRETESSGPWNTYFGAMGSGTNADGSDWYGPDVRELTAEVIDHWEQRAKALNHPVLRGRYADLVWEFSRKVANRRPDPEFARIAIDSYLDSVAQGLRPDEHDNIVVLKRATRLSAYINDNERIGRVKDALLNAFDKAVGQQSWWGQVSDELLENRKVGLTDDDRERMRAGWEHLFAGYTAAGVDGFDAHLAKSVGDYLIAFYHKVGARDTAARVSRAVSDAFVFISRNGTPMQAMGWLETAIEYTSAAGEKEQAKALRIEREEAIRQAPNEMQSFSTTMTITKEDMQAFLDIVIDKDRWQQAFFNIVMEFTDSKESLWRSVQREAKRAPLMAVLSSSVLAEDHQAAIVGSTEDDKEGNLVRRANLSQQLNRSYLTRAFDETIDIHRLTPEEIASFMFRCGLFDDFPLMREGISAWMRADYIKALFTLAPQVESAFRTLARNLGEAVTKPKQGKAGWEVSSNLGDFLAMKSVQDTLGDDIIFHIRSIFADARGMNLRNLVAHGLASSAYANWRVCDLIVHSLLLIAMYPEAKEAITEREERAAAEAAERGDEDDDDDDDADGTEIA